MSAEHNVPHQEREAKLLPVVGSIGGLVVLIMTVGYFLGNMIYQIP